MGLSMKSANGQGGYATVWKINADNGKWITAQVSTSYKKKDGSGYETDFQDSYVMFMFEAYEKIKEATIPEHGGLRIQITRFDLTSKYDKEKNTTYRNVRIFDFDIPDAASGTSASTQKKAEPKGKAKKSEPTTEEEPEEDLPF